MKVFINNLPTSPLKLFVVARECEGELWYWGMWDNALKACYVAADVGGEVYERDSINLEM